MPMEMVDNEAELARTTSGLIGVHERSCKYDPQNAPWPIGVAAGMPQYLANHNAISHYFNKVDRQKLRYLQNPDVISGKIQPDPSLISCVERGFGDAETPRAFWSGRQGVSPGRLLSQVKSARSSSARCLHTSQVLRATQSARGGELGSTKEPTVEVVTSTSARKAPHSFRSTSSYRGPFKKSKVYSSRTWECTNGAYGTAWNHVMATNNWWPHKGRETWMLPRGKGISSYDNTLVLTRGDNC